MRKTLRRSCDLCAKSKLRCDLLLPQCTRCTKRSPLKLICVYANTPLSSSLTDDITTISTNASPGSDDAIVKVSQSPEMSLSELGSGTFDPFESYPQIRLPRWQVQRLMQHFLSTIAFQYYPLDLQAVTNPFIVQWFPLALADPALFHVSLQTASLDVELRAQKGFTTSDILMADSVALVRAKVEHPTLAIQDDTMDSVVTLAAIELGKGNIDVSRMHIDGIKSMVRMRGGIKQVKVASPLTARMIAWVSMIVMQSPQFTTQDDYGQGNGIAPIPQWLEAAEHPEESMKQLLDTPGLDPSVRDMFCRLRILVHKPNYFSLSTTDFHDLTCFVLHRLLDQASSSSFCNDSHATPISETIRYATALYMLMAHGPTYYSHVGLQYTMTLQLKYHLERCQDSIIRNKTSLAIWLLSVGMIASHGTCDYHWFAVQAKEEASVMDIETWEGILSCLREVLWMEKQQMETLFRQSWESVWAVTGT